MTVSLQRFFLGFLVWVLPIRRDLVGTGNTLNFVLGFVVTIIIVVVVLALALEIVLVMILGYSYSSSSSSSNSFLL